eukprot:1140759-Pelagomonas_calceolata.AAC.9
MEDRDCKQARDSIGTGCLSLGQRCCKHTGERRNHQQLHKARPEGMLGMGILQLLITQICGSESLNAQLPGLARR